MKKSFHPLPFLKLLALLACTFLFAAFAGKAQRAFGQTPPPIPLLGADPLAGVNPLPGVDARVEGRSDSLASIDAAWPGEDGYGYYGEEVPYQWIEISSSGALISGLEDENYAGPFNIGFSFPFYGTSYTQFTADCNGYLVLGSSGSTAYTNQCPLPNSTAPNNVIAIYWDDLMANYSSGGAYYQSFSSCPVGGGQCLVVEYRNWTQYTTGTPSPGDAGTWEAILYASGAIRMQYQSGGVNTGSNSTTGIEGNNSGSNHGLTYACNLHSTILPGTALQFKTYPAGIYLFPETQSVPCCAGRSLSYNYRLYNNSGASATFNFTTSVSSGNGALTQPKPLYVGSNTTSPFTLEMQPSGSAGAGEVVNGTLQASGNGYSDSAQINGTVSGYETSFWRPTALEPENGRMDNVLAAYNGKIWSITGYGNSASVRSYDPQTDLWTIIGSSSPTFGVTYARSGCTSGSKVYFYGDAATANFTGLWSYNMATNGWQQETPSGAAPAQGSIWAPAWTYDPETNRCYLTGGATEPGYGNLTSVYVYDPAANAWLTSLPAFSTVRDFHAAFIFRRPYDNHKLLCVAGGANSSANLYSTQCYDFNTASWRGENADLGTLPGTWWGMGYASKLHQGSELQLWLVGGVFADSLTASAWYFDANTNTWLEGETLSGGIVYRTSAVTLDNEIYKLGGSISSFNYTGITEQHVQCPAAGGPGLFTIFMPQASMNFIRYFPGPNEQEDNDNFATANGPIQSGQEISGLPDDEFDIFYIDLLKDGSVGVELWDHSGSGVQLLLYDQDMDQPVKYDYAAPYELHYNGKAGRYYITIYSKGNYNSSQSYHVRITYP